MSVLALLLLGAFVVVAPITVGLYARQVSCINDRTSYDQLVDYTRFLGKELGAPSARVDVAVADFKDQYRRPDCALFS